MTGTIARIATLVIVDVSVPVRPPGFLPLVCTLLSVAGLAACTPAFDWRELRPDDAPMLFMMPAKASSLARDINLDGLAVRMRDVRRQGRRPHVHRGLDRPG
ncbi:MAG: hypothetical protein R3E68_17105 [Burkholderiaceae bacterium]